MGLSLSSIFLIYTGASIVQTFFVTQRPSVHCRSTATPPKRDLSAMARS